MNYKDPINPIGPFFLRYKMPFVPSNLRSVNNPGLQFFTYWTLEDTVRAVKHRGYFQDAQPILSVGSWIFVTASNGSCILHVDEIEPLELASPQ